MSDGSKRGLSRRDWLKLGAIVSGGAILPTAIICTTTAPDSASDPAGKDVVAGNSNPPTSTLGAGSGTAGGVKKTSGELPKKISRCRAKRPNVLLIVLDTVRAENLSCYGYDRQTTPHLEAFAATARRYTNVMSPAGYTLPSHASMFTGLPTTAHGANGSHQYLDRQSVTLAELLTASGYQTAAWSCNKYFVGRRCGLNRGFATFDLCDRASDLHDKLGRWFLQQYRPEEPFFIFLNYIEAHFPYTTPPEYALRWSDTEFRRWWWKSPGGHAVSMIEHMATEREIFSDDDRDQIEALYDDAISYLDTMLGQVFRFLDDNGMSENTLVIVTSDHGEQFGGKRIFGHGFSMYERILRVPLIIRHADRFPAGEDDHLVQTHDVFPTILDVAGVPWERKPSHTCENLLSQRAQPRLAVAEQLYPMVWGLAPILEKYPQWDCSRLMGRIRAIRSGSMKLIVSSVEESELYDVEKDPLELNDLAGKRPEVVEDLSRKFDGWVDSFPNYKYVAEAHSNVRAQTTEEEFRAGRGLGYVH